MTLRIRLAWPDKLLWPNGSQSNRWARNDARKTAREDAFWSTRKAIRPGEKFEHDGATTLVVTIHASAKQFGPLPDEQNVVIAHKAAIDGIADALKINDRFFAAPVVKFGERSANGEIIIQIENPLAAVATAEGAGAEKGVDTPLRYSPRPHEQGEAE